MLGRIIEELGYRIISAKHKGIFFALHSERDGVCYHHHREDWVCPWPAQEPKRLS